MDVIQTPANNVKGKLSNQIDRRRKRSYSPDRQRDSRDQKRDRHDYDDIYQDRPSKRRRSNSRSPSPPRRSRQPSPPHRSRQPSTPRRSRQPSPPRRSRQPSSPRRSRQPLPSQEDTFGDGYVMPQWKEFYTRARAIRNEGPLDECAKG